MFREWLPVLDGCSLFQGLSREQIGSLLPCFAPAIRSYQKGDTLRLAGQEQTTIGLVLEGEIQVQQEDYKGNRLIIGVFGPGELFGEVSAYAGTGHWPNNVLASKPGHVLFISSAKIGTHCENACSAHQLLVRNMLSIVAGKALVMNKRIRYIKMKSMREKLACYFFDLYRQQGSLSLSLPLNREDLADYLNVSRSSMSRELGRMRDEGLIEFWRSSLFIKDIQAMRHLDHNA